MSLPRILQLKRLFMTELQMNESKSPSSMSIKEYHPMSISTTRTTPFNKQSYRITKKILKKKENVDYQCTSCNLNPTFSWYVRDSWYQIRVLIGFSFNPMLSGERSSGDMQVGLRGLLGLPVSWLGRHIPYPIRKYSKGINIA